MADMRDRLIELLLKDLECDKNGNGNCEMCEYKYADKKCEKYLIRILADHLLANGVILPPCKVGDELFRIIKLTSGAYKPFVPTLPDKVEPYGIFYKGLMGEYRCIPFEEFGKTVFLTREEAEKALREKEKGKK